MYITMIKQESFTPTDEDLIPAIMEIAEREKQTKSKMIDILLHLAVKEKTRNRKKNGRHNSTK